MHYLQFMFLFNFQLPMPNSCFQFTNRVFMIVIFFLKIFRKQCKNSKMNKVHASIMTIHCVVIIAPLNKYYFVMIVKQQKNRPKIKPVFKFRFDMYFKWIYYPVKILHFKKETNPPQNLCFVHPKSRILFLVTWRWSYQNTEILCNLRLQFATQARQDGKKITQLKWSKYQNQRYGMNKTWKAT